MKKSEKRAKRSPFVTRGDRAKLVFGRMLAGCGFRRQNAVSELVVSLTSFPPRIGKLHLVIQSLLLQSLRPRKILLYLSLDEFPDRLLPRRLARLQGERFEIRYVRGNLKPYKKLLFALEEFPDSWIATFDDDRLYHRHSLARLWEAAAANPRTIVCAIGRRMPIENGAFLTYLKWRKIRTSERTFLLLPVGTCGILYPPGALHPLTGDRSLIQELAPIQDDLWFKVMSLKQGTPCRAIGDQEPMPMLQYEDKSRLWTLNEDRNDDVWRNLLAHFGMTPDSIAAQERQLQAEAGD